MSPSPTIPKKNGKENAYFVTANGYHGFRSYYGEAYRSDAFTRIFVLKGGPGTGKSRLMREVAEAAANMGAAVDCIYCSSDPTSLDGVIANAGDKRVAILDGTAPHTRCTPLPGVVDEILNLGEFWNPFALLLEKERISELSKKKSSAFALAYRYLSIAGTAMETALATAREALDKQKLHAFLLRRLKKATKTCFSETRILTDSIGMRGRVHLETMEDRANLTVPVGSRYGFDYLFFENAREILKKSEFSYTLIESPRDRGLFDGIYLEKDGVLLLSDRLAKEKVPPINPQRFFFQNPLTKKKGDIKRMLSTAEEMENQAINAFKSAGESHFALEEIYINAMDFARKEAFSRGICERISYLLS